MTHDDATTTALRMLAKYGVRLALEWANDHAFGHDSNTRGRQYWSAVYDRIKELSRIRAEDGSPTGAFLAPNGQMSVIYKDELICRARSHTMAKRIANALNNHTANERGE